MSLIAVLAWVGLGADGLSSSCYGPEEAFRALGAHTYLAVFLAMAMAMTVFIISRAYKLLIEHFPIGGGYVVATKLLGPAAGVVSGSALLVDYVLTIAISVASGGDALFSFLPADWLPHKLTIEIAVVILLMLMNLRGVKESVTVLFPIFSVFVLTHVLVVVWGIATSASRIPQLYSETSEGLRGGVHSLGAFGLFWLFLRAYCMGGGTYTGIEAVSNGVSIMREPKVATAQRTMTYMAVSLAFTAGGLLLCYMLMGIHPVEGQTMNAVLLQRLAGGLHLGPLNFGHLFVIVSLLSETLLLFVAAQT
ncbi:MAG: APC family permease, partial [Candidatus Wallbacteria bacterium]|nr:APC family permease [Candidatus Wallbacteria bacterium]